MSAIWQRTRVWVALLAIAVIVLLVGLLAWTEVLWFDALGFRQVVTSIWGRQILLFLAGTAFGLAVLGYNLRLCRRLDEPPLWATHAPDGPSGGPLLWAALPTLMVLLSLAIGWAAGRLWQPWLLFAGSQPTGQTDPLLGIDLAFYLTRLPFLQGVQRLVFGTCAIAWLLLYVRYIDLPVPGDPDSYPDFRAVTEPARAHLSAFGVVVMLLFAWGFWLQRYALLTSRRSDVVFGAGYCDEHLRLPLLMVMTIVSLLAAVGLARNVRRRSLGQLGWIAGLFALAAAGNHLLPLAFQQLVVKPSEIDRERPYIERTITATRQALGLDRAEPHQYQVTTAISAGALRAEEEVLSTVPLWSAAEMTEQLVGTEALRGYYNLTVTDYDRYRFGSQRQQVALAVREMQVDRLEASARNWINRHLIYTHGFGAVMASAHRAGPAGEPVKIVQDIPPRGPSFLTDFEPRIYYGELTDNYAVTGLRSDAEAQEFDYPSGDSNVYRAYQGAGGVGLGGGLRKLAFALRFRSINLLLSDLPAADARVHFRRQILPRVQRLAPFLDFDSEPYPVLAGGRVSWVLDGYTYSKQYPYAWPHPLLPAIAVGGQAQPERFIRGDVSYLRNAVKAVVDAYDGTVTFYVYDQDDPLLKAYRAAFPELFVDGPLPEPLAAHVRYPADLFALQAKAYTRFHMTDPKVFYNLEDLWDTAREETTYRTPNPDGTYRFDQVRDRMAPYYVLLRLPGDDVAKFRLILPFTPAGAAEASTQRDNMIGWMSADCEPDSYGKLTVFHFPKNTLTYGPLQVEALIDQDPEISQQMTLWSEQGSRVLRGRLLVIPLGSSLLYVEPLYITAERRGALPELKRVVVFYNGRVRMAETLDDALRQTLSGEQSTTGAVELLRLRRLAADAANAFHDAEASRSEGNLAGYGESIGKAKQAVDEMRSKPE